MKVLELLEELEDIVDSSAGVPLTGKILVDAEEILEILKEIRVELPDEIKQAQWIKDERQRILNEAQKEYDVLIKDAKAQAESLIDNDDIMEKSRKRAEKIIMEAEDVAKDLRISTLEYIDHVLYEFQSKMSNFNHDYVEEMYSRMQQMLGGMTSTLADNRDEIREMLFKAQNMGLDQSMSTPMKKQSPYIQHEELDDDL